MTRLLLEAGGDASYADEDGWTALHAAAVQHDAKLVDLLVTYGAKIDARTFDSYDPEPSMTPLMIAVSRGIAGLNLICRLMHHGADIDLMDAVGSTPRDIATDQTTLTTFSTWSMPPVPSDASRTSRGFNSSCYGAWSRTVAQHPREATSWSGSSPRRVHGASPTLCAGIFCRSGRPTGTSLLSRFRFLMTRPPRVIYCSSCRSCRRFCRPVRTPSRRTVCRPRAVAQDADISHHAEVRRTYVTPDGSHGPDVARNDCLQRAGAPEVVAARVLRQEQQQGPGETT